MYGKLLNLAGLERAIAENPAAMLYGHGIKFARGGKVAQLGERTIDAATARDGFHKRGATVVVNEFERIHQPTMALAEVRRTLLFVLIVLRQSESALTAGPCSYE
eukprot:SAG31_NODE_7129_length_1781_cov_1.981570_1_plen_105_part_00